VSGPKIDVNFINPFIDGAIETFKVQCAVEPKAGKPYVRGKSATSNAIEAVIALNSAVFNGTIALCFPEKVFLGLMEKMLGEKYTEINKELEDGASELLNIIFGQAKKVLNDKGYAIQKAIPSIYRGDAVVARSEIINSTLVLPFEMDAGIFHIEICTDQQV
jgi:chemotaxis protein CheX